MTLITIRETRPDAEGHKALISFDRKDECPVIITNPFDEEEEKRLGWYFEEHLRFPFTDDKKAEAAAVSIQEYGERLFAMLFPDRFSQTLYAQAMAAGVTALAFEISGSPEFHALHWEALKDPLLPRPFALEVPFARQNLKPSLLGVNLPEYPTLNILLVTARPGGRRDVAFRTISRPLVEAVRNANLRVRIDLVRPGTYRALCDMLESARDRNGGNPFYHIVHFDTHGAVLTFEELGRVTPVTRLQFNDRFGRGKITPYEGKKAFLFLESEGPRRGDKGKLVPGSGGDPLEATELAALLKSHQTPVVMLNACQSAQAAGEGGSLAAYLMTAGVQVAVGMAYSVTVSAAETLLKTVYPALYHNADLETALRRGRLALHDEKSRRAYFDRRIDLEDWLLPVVYQTRKAIFRLRPLTPQEQHTDLLRKDLRFAYQEPLYGFIGRDLDVLEIEHRLLARDDGLDHNLLLVQGLGGAGKTSLLRHLGRWWQSTGLVGDVFYFGYDEKAYTCQQIVHAIALKVLGEQNYQRQFQPLGEAAGRQWVIDQLRGTRHLLLLDNLETVTGQHLAVGNRLNEKEQAALRQLLLDLSGGQTLALLGSRGGEDWLQAEHGGPLRADGVYELGGLDEESASQLADRILAEIGAERYREEPEFKRLVERLEGLPLALEVILANLKSKTPAAVLAEFFSGAGGLDRDRRGPGNLLMGKTESILDCIEYSYNNLSAGARRLLLCLAPFQGVIYHRLLPQYTELLKKQPELADLPFDRWEEALGEARGWGLLSPHPEVPIFLRIHPLLPHFLRARLSAEGEAGLRAGVQTAFREFYEQFGLSIVQLLTSQKPEERQIGFTVARLEEENLLAGLDLALAAQMDIWGMYTALDCYWESTREIAFAIQQGERIRARLESYPPETLRQSTGLDLGRVIGDLGNRHLVLKTLGVNYRSRRSAKAKGGRALSKLRKIKKLCKATLAAKRACKPERSWLRSRPKPNQFSSLS